MSCTHASSYSLQRRTPSVNDADWYSDQNRYRIGISCGGMDDGVGRINLPGRSSEAKVVGYAHAPQIRPRRLPFAAELRATEFGSGREVWGETANLSKGGCYVRTSQSFREGALILIEIRSCGVSFQTDARVVYALDREGMGLAFLNVPAKQLPILEDWLSSAGRERPTETGQEASE